METKTFDKVLVQNFETIGCACSLELIDGKKDCCKKYKKKGKFCGGCPKK